MSNICEPDIFYSYWNDLLDGKKPPFYDGQPQGGTFSLKRGGAKLPVRIDRDQDGKVCAWINGELADNVNKVWLACGRNAVSWDAYCSRLESGRWPDEAPGTHTGPLTMDYARAWANKDGELSSVIGDNEPPPDVVHELLPYTIERVRAWFSKLRTFSTAEEVQAAADHANALRSLIGKARKLHKEEKEPFLEGGQAVDRKYLDGVKRGDELVREIGRAVAYYEEGQRIARAQEEAELRTAAEAKAQEALKAAAAAPPERQIDLMKAAAASLAIPTSPPAETRFKSSTGKKGFTVKPKIFAEVADQDALYNAVKERPEVVALLAKIAQAELDSGYLLPGVSKVEGVVAK